MQNKAFTLIEILVVITIIALLSILAYAPYNHYSNVARVRFSAQKVEQTVNEARSMVLGWYSLTGANVHVWVIFSPGAKEVSLVGFPYHTSTGAVDDVSSMLIRKIPLEEWVALSDTASGMIVFFSPLSEAWIWHPGWMAKDGKLDIVLSYKKASVSSSLSKTLHISGSNVTIQ